VPGLGIGPFAGGVAESLYRPADQPRDVHLREPDALCDLRLGQPVLEAHAEDLAVALG
jgi:hypothetical protein